ncbi:MAG: alpha/beta fold hydrolase [Jatrophihabitans sp.]|uniref:alpha/beta fold hydrolase n=1 Tax=Jatrophihabitans sp. TaxID=1932789 RepID=UPI003911C943
MTPPLHVESTSADGTVVTAYVEGTGPSVLLVHGSTADHTRWAPLVPLLRDEFTLVMLDRRGRGGSTAEAEAYAIEREGEDVLAMFASLPDPAMVFGHSYGATATLSVLDRVPAAAVLLYEPPFATPEYEVFSESQLSRWQAALDEGRREAVLEMFYREALRFDEAAIDAMRPLPIWAARLAAVHTVVREARAVRTFAPRPVRAAGPVRFLSGDSTTPHLTASTRAAADLVAGSDLVVLAGQGHVAIDAAPELIADQVRKVWQLTTT